MSDPYALAAAPQPDMSWLDELEDDDPLAIEPEYDEDYVEAPEPDLDDIKTIIDELRTDHGLRIGQAREMGEAYDGDRPGHFEEDEEDIANGIVEEMPITVLRQMYDFRCGFIASHEPFARLLNRDAIDRDEAMAVEELIAYDFRCEERQFADATGGDLRITEPEHLQRCGMMVGLDVLNPKDEYSGLTMSLIDPTTVFPVFAGASGLIEVYRQYEDTAENIAGNYGGQRGSAEYQRLKRILDKEGSGRKKRDLTRSTNRPVTECWNDDWLTVIVDDDTKLLSRKHGYHENPFTVVVGNFDLPAAMSSGTSYEDETITTRNGEIVLNDRSVDIARRYRPYDWKKLKTHRIAEAVAGRQLSMFKWAIDPAMVLEEDPTMKKFQGEVGRMTPGARIRVSIPNKLTVVTPVVDPSAIAGLNMALAANAQAGILGQLASGTVPPQTCGSAMNAMIEIGGSSDAVLVRKVTLFKQLRAEKRLRLRKKFGGMLGKAGDRGYISVPSRNPGSRTPMHRVTPAIINRVGCQVEVELYSWRPDVTAAQYVATLRAPSAATGLPLISDETARIRLKTTPDHDREGERIEDELLRAQPPVAMQRNISRLKRERDMALEEGDDESADASQVAIQNLEFMYDAQVQSGAAAPVAPGGASSSGAAGPPVPEPPTTPVLPGTSLPDQGIGVGNQGARPEGTEQPVVNPNQPSAMTPIGPERTY